MKNYKDFCIPNFHCYDHLAIGSYSKNEARPSSLFPWLSHKCRRRGGLCQGESQQVLHSLTSFRRFVQRNSPTSFAVWYSLSLEFIAVFRYFSTLYVGRFIWTKLRFCSKAMLVSRWPLPPKRKEWWLTGRWDCSEQMGISSPTHYNLRQPHFWHFCLREKLLCRETNFRTSS